MTQPNPAGESHDSLHVRLIFIHGAGNNATAWSNQTTFFPAAEAVTLPGHRVNETETVEGMRSVEEYARWLRQYLQVERNVDGLSDRVILVGHSMGAAVAMSYCLQFPEGVAGLVLVGAGAKMPVSHQILEGLQNDFQMTAVTIANFCFTREAPQEMKNPSLESMLQIGPRVTLGDFIACNNFDLSGQLSQLGGRPVLVVTGEKDKMTPPDSARFLAEQIPGARLELIPGGGHSVQIEKPDDLNRALAGFLAAEYA